VIADFHAGQRDAADHRAGRASCPRAVIRVLALPQIQALLALLEENLCDSFHYSA
jgi:hypothetical protein